MALQSKSGNVQLSRNMTTSLKPKNIAVGNENTLPGKSIASNTSKIPTRSVLGLVNSNLLPDRKNTSNIPDFKKPATRSSLLKKTAPLSTKFSSTSSLNQNVIQNSNLKPPTLANVSVVKNNAAVVKPPLKAPNKQQTKLRPRLVRNDSTASILCSALQNNTRSEISSEIEKCEQNLNNVSLEEDIDAKDVGDPFLLGDYVKDIYDYLFTLEEKNSIQEDYLQVNCKSPTVKRSILPKYRAILVDYMVDMQLNYNLYPETLYLAVYLLDKYLELDPTVTKSNLQCVGVSAMFLAAKFEEVQMPDVTEFAAMTENYVKVNDILAMEVQIIKKIDFNFSRPNALAFLRRFSKVAGADKMCHIYAKYFIELALNNYAVVHERPSKIAAAALYLAHVVHGKTDMRHFWSKTLIHYTRYTQEELTSVLKHLAQAVLDNANEKSPKYRALKDKYSKSANSRISINPALTVPSAAVKALAQKL